MFVLRPFLFPYEGCRTRALSSACKADQADFTNQMSFLPSNLMDLRWHFLGHFHVQVLFLTIFVPCP